VVSGPAQTTQAVGIDLGATAIYAVKVMVGEAVSVVDARVYLPEALDGLVAFCAGSSAVAIDSPAGPSVGAHYRDMDVPPKFRSARCSEVASWEAPDVPAVPWTTPLASVDPPGWMATGFRVWQALSRHQPMEVYPYACFYRLNGSKRPPSKQQPEGRLRRAELLRRWLDLPLGIEVWSHDGLDATVAALVAAQGRKGADLVPHQCAHHDGSELWVVADS
jgi:predicted nuclease with RNAse H fold